jgi:hypothetical protein
MQMIENISRIDGCIMARRPSKERQDWDDITVLLERAEKVDDRAELLHRQLGTEVTIGVPRDLLGEAKPGDAVEGHVSIVGPGKVFASPQSVDGGRFVIVPAED